MKISSLVSCFLLLASMFLIASCGPSSIDSALDSARFQLDNCDTDNAAACASAVENADTVLASDPNNVEAAIIKSSALATSGQIDILDMMSNLAETETEDDIDQTRQKFKFIRHVLVDTVDISYLRQAVDALKGIVDAGAAPEATNPTYENFYFRLGMLQALEAFIRPVKLAQPIEGADVTVAATEAITDEESERIQEDFIDADDNLGRGGINNEDDIGWDLVEIIRNNYGAVRNVNTTNAGFSTAELRALMRCQLHDDPDSLLDPATEFPGTTTITTCGSFKYTDWEGDDTEE